MIHLDSSFVIDLLRETSRGRPGPALEFMEGLDDGEQVGVSVHVLCELVAGVELSRSPEKELREVAHLTRALEVFYPDARFAPVYGRLLASIERMKQKVSAMDLLIATAAIIEGAPLVTKNRKDFVRIPGLKILDY